MNSKDDRWSCTIIEGMRLPQSCRECLFGVFGFCYVAPDGVVPKCPKKGRAKWCPMKEAKPMNEW